MAPHSEKNTRKRTWDHEKDLYDFLLHKIRDPDTQKKKLNDLLHKFYINDPKADSDLIKFTDGPSSIIRSQLLHLQEQNSDSNNNDDEEENLIEYEEERYRFLLNHIKRDGKSYVLDIVEDGEYVKLGDESSCAKKKGKLGVKKSKGGKRRNVQTNRMTSRKGGRGRKMKAATILSAAKKRGISNKKSDVASKAHKNAGKRKRGRPRKILEKNDVNVEENVSVVKSAFIDESVKKEIQDDAAAAADDDDDVIDIVTVESSDKEVNPRKVAEFREKLMKEINRPYCEEEHKKLSREINARTPVQKYRDLRGSCKTYKGDHDGKSFLDHHLDLLKELEAARDDFPKVLRLLRGFFFWLKYSTQDGAFMPWRDPSCLDELPQQ